MTLREFLLKNAPRHELERKQRRKEWIEAVEGLLSEILGWLNEANTDKLLECVPVEVDKREQGLGSYRIPGLEITFGERVVKILPVGRSVLAHLGPYAEPGHENAEGRVDISNGVDKVYLYRKLSDSGASTWLVQNGTSALRPLGKAEFEAILQALLS
jgi:hypothetical protein